MAFDIDGVTDLESAINQAVGYASLCWSKTPAGIFDTDAARQCALVLLSWVKEHQEPLLGLATTKDLMTELVTRLEVSRITTHEANFTEAERRAEQQIKMLLLELPQRALVYRTVDA